jgi:molybdopterin-synthase adenylyltransferase
VLSDADVERYSRQILLAEVGGRGQERLRAAAIGISLLDDRAVVREAMLLGALHLAVAGIGRIVLTGARARVLTAELEPLVRERNPGASILASGSGTDLMIGFGDVPETDLPWIAALLGESRTGILSSATGGSCERCRAALADLLATGGDGSIPAVAPFLAATVATAALRPLLGFGLADPPARAFDVARAAPLAVDVVEHDCASRTGS